MSQPRGYDAPDAPHTQVIPPHVHDTGGLPPTQALGGYADGTQVLPTQAPGGHAEGTTVLPSAQEFGGYVDGTAVLPRAQSSGGYADGTQVLPAAPGGLGEGTQVLPSAPSSGGYADGTQVLPNAAPPRRTSSRPVGSLSAPAATPAPHAPVARAAAPVPAAPAPQPAPQPTPQPTSRPAAAAPWDAAPAAAPGRGPASGPGREPEPARRGTEPTAVAALVTGILGFVVPLLGVLAIILGGIALDRTRRRRSGGRGMAKTGIAFGSIQVVFTAIVVIAGLFLWNTYGDDIQQALDEAEQLTQTDLSIPDMLLGGLTGDLSFGDLQDLAGTLGDADQLQELGGQCQAGDPVSCEDLLDRLPDGIRDQLPEDLTSRLPGS